MTKRTAAKASSASRHATPHKSPRSTTTRIHPRSVPDLIPENDGEETPDQPFVEGAHDEIDPDLRYRMISEAAYHLYAERNYADGGDLDDWLQAEAEVDHLLLNRRAGDAGQ
jgi:hypothetical protein